MSFGLSAMMTFYMSRNRQDPAQQVGDKKPAGKNPLPPIHEDRYVAMGDERARSTMDKVVEFMKDKILLNVFYLNH